MANPEQNKKATLKRKVEEAEWMASLTPYQLQLAKERDEIVEWIGQDGRWFNLVDKDPVLAREKKLKLFSILDKFSDTLSEREDRYIREPSHNRASILRGTM